MTQTSIPLDNLEEGPVRHSALPPVLVARIEEVHLALREVYASSLEEWLEDFQRDAHPEQEVAWWERLAQCYRTYKNAHPLDYDQRQAVFRVLLTAGMGISPEMESADLAILPKGSIADLQTILRKHGL